VNVSNVGYRRWEIGRKYLFSSVGKLGDIEI